MDPKLNNTESQKKDKMSQLTKRMVRAAFLVGVLVLTMHGQSTIQPLRTILEVKPIGSGMMLGTGILGLGDVNNDGWPDFAVSARATSKTFVYYGGPGVLDDTPDLVLKGGAQIGKGDLNGDGRIDLVTSKLDTLFLYCGRPAIPHFDTIPNLVFSAETIATSFGQTFALGDLNDDGLDDLVVTAYAFSQARGKLYVYLGKTQLAANPDFVGIGDTVRSLYGYGVGVADINGDGIVDLAVSSDDRRGFQTIDIFCGHSGWTFSKDGYNQRLDSRQMGNLGYLCSFGLLDINADRRADISFGGGGKAYFVYGSPDSMSPFPDLVLENPDTNFYTGLGGPAVDVGDINNDGVSDFVLRATLGGPAECIVVYLASSRRLPKPVAGRCKAFVGTEAFQYISGLGDVNGDGVNDFAACVPRDPLSSLPQDGYFVILSGDATLTVVGENRQGSFQKNGILRNYPNPFNAETIIEYSLAKGGEVLLIIYDPLGREVRRLQQGEQGPGLHQVAWDGKTSLGDNAASGAYYYSLVVDKATVGTTKLLLLR
jgi:hypothetical protein